MSELQLFDALEPAVEAALRASIRRWGVLVPIFVSAGPWAKGTVIDGHHRDRLAREEGCGAPTTIALPVDSEDEAKELARTLNMDRRHMDADQRRIIVADLRSNGHSIRAIAGAVGVSKSQIAKDLDDCPPVDNPERITRQGGGTYPSRRPPTPHEEVPDRPFLDNEATWPAGWKEPVELPTPEQIERRTAALHQDLEERVRNGSLPLKEAESVVRERQARTDTWADNLREALRRLTRMVGHPIPPDLADALGERETALVQRIITYLEGDDYGFLG